MEDIIIAITVLGCLLSTNAHRIGWRPPQQEGDYRREYVPRMDWCSLASDVYLVIHKSKRNKNRLSKTQC